MPHLTLHYSRKLCESVSAGPLFAPLHEALGALETVAPGDLKSRAIPLDEVVVGNGEARRVFAHLEIALLAGRDISVRQRIAQIALKALSHYFSRSLTELDCQLSVEVREMDRASYGKVRSGDSPAADSAQ